MGNFKYKLKEAEQPKVGDIDVQNGTKYTVTSVDPNSGAVEWSVEKVADYESAFETIHKSKELFDALIKQPGAKDDFKIRQIASQVREVVNNYRTHLRKNYPEEYNKVKSLSEESTTGGGIGQAGFTSGTEGENYAAPIGYKYKLAKKPLKEADFDVNQLIKDQNITNPAMVDWISKRVESFDTLERQLNQLIPMLQQAKKETIRKYSQDPSFAVIYGTDLAQEYLQDIIELFKQPE
jgi:hypothetical protein